MFLSLVLPGAISKEVHHLHRRGSPGGPLLYLYQDVSLHRIQHRAARIAAGCEEAREEPCGVPAMAGDALMSNSSSSA